MLRNKNNFKRIALYNSAQTNMSNMRVFVASDLHTEFIRPEFFNPSKYFSDENGDTSSDILCLAGDIGVVGNPNLVTLMKYVVDRYYKVLFVAGNHEYYGCSIESGNKYMSDMCKSIGVVFLNNGIYSIDSMIGQNIVFIGSTLWSDIQPEHEHILAGYLNDYSKIAGWTPKDSTTSYWNNYQWLENMVETHKNKKVFVITHHAPLTKGTSNPSYEGKVTNTGFASDCTEIMERGVDHWIFGHTHFNAHLCHRFTQIHSNQYGYSKKGDRAYNPKFYLEA